MCAKWKEETIERKSAEFEKIAAVYRVLNNEDLEIVYSAGRMDKEVIEDKLSHANQHLMVMEALFAERAAEEGWKSTRFTNGDLITVTFESPVSVENKQAFVDWVKARGLEHELSVNYQTMRRLVKEYVSEQLTADPEAVPQLPDGTVKGEPVAKLTFTRSK